MSSIDNLLNQVQTKRAKIGIIGLGYVGLPLALLFASKGFRTTGFVRNPSKAKLLMGGKSNLSDEDIDDRLQQVIEKKLFKAVAINKDELSNQDVIIICVPTPVDDEKKPDLTDLKSVGKTLSELDLSQKLIINESTVAPFTTREVLGNLNGDYFLATSPERIDPGNKTKTTESIPKVVGGISEESTNLAKALYQQIMTANVVAVSSMETAEMAKMLENTYRAVNIALIDEFAMLADKTDIDILEVIKAAQTKWSFHPHYPGIGVGGHCIPVDPYYIVSLAKDKGIDMHVVSHALSLINAMPRFVADKVARLYKKGMKVLVYGITYKKDVNDMRESPAIVFCELLKKKGIPFSVYDPIITVDVIEKKGFSPGSLEQADLFVVGTDHSALASDYPKVVSNNTIIIDGRNFFIDKVGKAVYGVGRTLL